MIAVKDLRKTFGKFSALDNLSCNVEKGSIYGLVGYNGAGKTTLLKTISGVYKPDGGRVLIDGEGVFNNEEIKRRIFFVPDDLYFLFQANMNRMARFYRGYYPNWSDNVYQKLTKIFDLDPTKRINGFSKGMQRQAAIILALSTQPEYLLLDESFDGLDPAKRSLVKQLLMEVMAEKEISILISSHNLRELEDLCDHIGLIKDKHIVYDCSIEDMRVNRTKYRIVFKTDISEDAFSGINYKNFNRNGNVVTFITNGSTDEVRTKLEALNPAILEALPLTLEEIYLYEMEVGNYDFKDIFQ